MAETPASVRVACVQYGQTALDSYEAFEERLAFFVGIAASYRSDFVVFPEMFTLQLLTVKHRGIPASQVVGALDGYTARLKTSLMRLAKRHKIHICGGSHFLRDAKGIPRNVSFLALPDGTLHEQAKIHATPSERDTWGIVGGDAAAPVMTAFGPVATTICYDVEFPELQRHLVDAGARLILVPFCTDDRRGYMRVRHCAQARAVENQCYLALAGNVGNLPFVENMDIQYAESCLVSPCDLPFARDGLIEIAPAGVETLVFADLDLAALDAARAGGTVRNLADRRGDLYGSGWK